MAAITRPLARTMPLQGRMFSAVASQAESAAVDREPKYNLKKLDNGLAVASVDTASPVARIAVVAKAGSRNECSEGHGMSHLLRRAAVLKTQDMSQIGLARNIQQCGSDVTVEGTREYVMYKSSMNRDMVGSVSDILREITTKQAFRRWEVEDLQASPLGIKLDLAVLANQPHIRAVELLHEAAYKHVLGRSLYMPAHNIGKFTNANLQQYCERNFAKGRLALVGVGIDSATLESIGSQFVLGDPQPPKTGAATYHGGEIHQNGSGNLSYVALAFEGPSVGSQDLLAAELLKHIVGVGSSIKYAPYQSTSAMSKATTAATDAPHYVSGLTANYSDSGLFGFAAAAPSTAIAEVVQAAANGLKSVLSSPVKEADVARAKNQLKASIGMQLENQDSLLNWVGEQALTGDKLLTPADVVAMVDSVTVADVNAVAKKISSSKPSMAATGHTGYIPYLDQLLS